MLIPIENLQYLAKFDTYSNTKLHSITTTERNKKHLHIELVWWHWFVVNSKQMHGSKPSSYSDRCWAMIHSIEFVYCCAFILTVLLVQLIGFVWYIIITTKQLSRIFDCRTPDYLTGFIMYASHLNIGSYIALQTYHSHHTSLYAKHSL